LERVVGGACPHVTQPFLPPKITLSITAPIILSREAVKFEPEKFSLSIDSLS
jgi:hypothetical protein